MKLEPLRLRKKHYQTEGCNLLQYVTCKIVPMILGLNPTLQLEVNGEKTFGL
jgi:hypothetical protein